MPVPAVVATDLVVVEADFALAGLEGLLDCPAAAGDVDEVAEAGGGRPVAEVVGEISRVGQVAPHQQPVPVAGGLQRPDRLTRPVVDPRALGPGTGGDTLNACAGRVAASVSARTWAGPVPRSAHNRWLVGIASTCAMPRSCRKARSPECWP